MMDRITDILVIVNPLVRDQPAVAKAAALARWLGAAIELLVCDTKESREARVEDQPEPISNLRPGDKPDELLDEFAEPLRDDGIDVTTHIISGQPLHQAVLAWMRNSPADMLVKDTHHHTFARRALAVNTDAHLIRACGVPLLLTKSKVWGTPPVLMAAVDSGHADGPSLVLDQCILNVTVSLAKRMNAHVHVVHASVPAIVYAAAGGVLSMAPECRLRRSQIRELTDPYGVADPNLHVDAGVAAEYVPRMAAELHADIVVMGAFARSSLKRALLGGTAEHVLEALPCDVLVVKPADFAQDLPFGI